MSVKNNKPGSLFKNIIIIYIAIIAITSLLNSSTGNIRIGFAGVVPIIVILIILSQVLTTIKKANQEKGEFTIKPKAQATATKASNKNNSYDKSKYSNPNDKMNRIDNTPKDKPYSKLKKQDDIGYIDLNNHYLRQYKELYEAGIMTKEELKDKILKYGK